jgi:hypothetical protein
MKRSLYAIFVLCLCAGLARAEEGRPWMGVNVEVLAELPPTPGLTSTVGIRLTNVQAKGPAARAGLLPDDIVVSVDQTPLTCPPGEALAFFLKALNTHEVGGTLKVVVIRNVVEISAKANGRPVDTRELADTPRRYLEKAPPGTFVEIQGRKERRLVPVDVILGRRDTVSDKVLLPNDKLLAGLSDPDWRTAVEEVVAAAGMETGFRDLLARLKRCHDSWDGYALRLAVEAHRDPFRTEAAARHALALLEEAAASGPAGLGDIVTACARLADRPVKGGVTPARTGLSPASHARQIESLLLMAHREILGAFARLSAEEKNLLKKHRAGITEPFTRHIYLHADTDTERAGRNIEVVKVAAKVDSSAFFRAALILGGLVHPDYVAGLKADLLRAYGSDAAKAILLRHNTDLGEIVFAGTAANWHKSPGTVVVVDLGGDDVYSGATTSGNSFDRPVGLIIDFAGDDAYNSTTDMAVASGSLGVSLLADIAGNDRYTALRWSQASGFFGVGVLSDWAGNDVYRGEELSQAVGCVGAGILVDFAGNDRYEGRRYNQGVGLPAGVGLLLDAAGDDEYYSGGRHPSGYGTHGIFEGWSQGCGVGFRQYAAGGLGILLDRGGRDRYESGNFGQGGGYYFGMGILADQGRGNDHYIGSRYNQGFSAHQAVGVFLEEGGNDFYTTRNGVAQGLAWDECVTLFLEEGGDDTYVGGSGFSQGASAHNAFCLFRDKGGRDTYRYGPGQARAGKNDYHGGTSFSFFVEEGGAQDRYDKAGRNGTVITGKENFAFLDLPGSLAEAMKEGAWKALWKEGRPTEKKKEKKKK